LASLLELRRARVPELRSWCIAPHTLRRAEGSPPPTTCPKRTMAAAGICLATATLV